MNRQYNFIIEGWLTNLFKGPTAKNLEEAKSLYIKAAMEYGRLGMQGSWINARMEHFTNVINKYPNTKSIIVPLLKRIQAIGEVDNFTDYACVIVGFCEINLRLFKKFGSIYCDKGFKHMVSELEANM